MYILTSKYDIFLFIHILYFYLKWQIRRLVHGTRSCKSLLSLSNFYKFIRDTIVIDKIGLDANKRRFC